MKSSHRWLGCLLLLTALVTVVDARGEEECSGPTYNESTCAAACTQDKCQDVSFNQDGSEFQCCPPEAQTPELPKSVGPFALALVLVALLYARKRWGRAKSA
jgi:hypothetical protein